MAQVISTNFASLNAQRNLDRSSMDLQTSLQRLSSGLRINSARDDAAGLAISERFTAQIRGLNQAVRNANDGVSLAQTAEGALGEVTSNLQRIRELSVQAVNGTNSDSDRAAIQAEVDQLVAEVDRVAGQTSFNGVKLLDGTFSSQSFQIGANAGETISVSIGDATASSLGANATVTTTGLSVSDGAASASRDASGLVINGTTINTASDGVSTTDAAGSANALAAAINSSSATTGVTATANATEANLGSVAASTIASGELSINGVEITATVLSGDSDGALTDAINAVSNQTGVTAALDGSNNLVLTAADGRNIQLETDGTNAAATFGGFALNGGSANDDVVIGTVTLDSDAAIVVGTGIAAATNGQTIGTGTTQVSTTNSVSNIDVTSASGASSAITNVDRALATVNSLRADLGAFQNRMESTIANLQTSSENASAARSRIRDADFAAETASLTRNQILQQAGTAMLAQANAAPQNVLSLLR